MEINLYSLLLSYGGRSEQQWENSAKQTRGVCGHDARACS
jgi:hypothetical protein